ncbi:sucrase ferredoxin domain-containing protein [Colletotrichum truncatum]|uniref:Sucrase ferredoxin domain-containing protein n=1 Tax=Colletotrichum truncatum TaxID=5467 RepID=A0ACC3ZA08_COLTU|nr:sucrase ferredoxin domain-containing protein [Colletotrichum truncatum]KAF6796044.1 sucrase ferredoxin domain-containing protein [Colletotrichum truncatum]
MFSPRAIFRFIYGSFYFVLCFLLAVLLLITPGDTIYQAYSNNQPYNIWIIAATLALTILIVSFIYATRLYLNKTILAAIPKPWVPIERGDVKKKVHEMITADLRRSAAIAYDSRPRVETNALVSDTEEAFAEKTSTGGSVGKKRFQLVNLTKPATTEKETGIALPPRRPVWGEIEHYGWSSPNSVDLPDLQYSTVISELPNLIEAKALTSAPPDPTSSTRQPMLDPDAVALLQRPLHMGLRDYFGHLAELGVISLNATSADFLAAYEYARFSTRPISNARFRELMHLFAAILRGMRPLDPTVLGPLDEPSDESDIDNDAPMATNPTTPRSNLSRSVTQSTQGSYKKKTAPQVDMRNSSAHTWLQYRTAPATPMGTLAGAISRSSSLNSFAQTRPAYEPGNSSSSASLRSKTSGSSASGSVIRLATRTDSTDLPYVLTLRDTR